MYAETVILQYFTLEMEKSHPYITIVIEKYFSLLYIIFLIFL